MFAPYLPPSDDSEPAIPQNQLPPLQNILDPIFIFSLIWSVGATVDHEGRIKFDGFLRKHMKTAGVATLPPFGGLIYDFCFDIKAASWRGWMDTIPPYVPDLSLPFSQLIVPTIDSVRYRFLLDLLMRNGKHVLCVGPTGTGKTVSITDAILNSMPSKYPPFF